MRSVGKIDREIYKCITEDMRTDEVIITEERIQHIMERHPEDYERYSEYIPSIIAEPDYIVKDELPDTAILLKKISLNKIEIHFRLSLRLITTADDPLYKNSIITFMKTNVKEYARLLRNKRILYKRQ